MHEHDHEMCMYRVIHLHTYTNSSERTFPRGNPFHAHSFCFKSNFEVAQLEDRNGVRCPLHSPVIYDIDESMYL